MKLQAETTIFNDQKVQNKFSELIVDADGIRTEVGTKVGNNEVISRINQSAESIKIQANKINIEGVITAVNDNSYTTIDGDKITTGTLSASAVDASSGTFNSANIPNLSANKITTDTINIARIPSSARNDTYITDISGGGIQVHDASDTTSYVQINSNGMKVHQNNADVAEFGSTTRVGATSSGHITLSSNGIYVSPDAYNTNFSVGLNKIDVDTDMHYTGKLIYNGLIQMPVIEVGSVSMGSVSANSYKDVSVSFTGTGATPIVICSIYSTAQTGDIGLLTASAINIGTQGCTIRVFNAGSSARSPGVHWAAFFVL